VIAFRFRNLGTTVGKAMNISISPFFYATPLRSPGPALDEQVRKVPLFAGRNQVEPGDQVGLK